MSGTAKDGGGTIGGALPVDGNKVTGTQDSNTGGGICVYRGNCTIKNVTIQNNRTAVSGNGSGVWLHGAHGGTAKLTIEETVIVKDNNLMIGNPSDSPGFLTAHNLASAAFIDIRPQDYPNQKDKPLVKASGTKPANWENRFRLVNIPSGQNGHIPEIYP